MGPRAAFCTEKLLKWIACTLSDDDHLYKTDYKVHIVQTECKQNVSLTRKL